jgi:competence protein ComEC
MTRKTRAAIVAVVGLAVAWPSVAQEVEPSPTSPNEAVVIRSASGAEIGSVSSPTIGPDAPRILHEDELLFHDQHPAGHEAAMRPDWMAAHVIDVGQGAAILLEFSCGAALIDTGGQEDEYVDGNAKLMTYLERFFARRPDLKKTLDVVFLTHAHSDHTSGAGVPKKSKPTTPQTPGLIPPTGTLPYKIRNVVTNGETSGSGIGPQKALINYASSHAIPVTQVFNSDIRRSDGLTSNRISPIACGENSPTFRVLWGSERAGHGWEDNGNNHSLAIRVEFGASSFLFIGDLEQDAQPEFVRSYARHPTILDVDVYMVGHHGSRNGTTRQLMQAMSPQIAVMGAGDPSRDESGFTAHDFGHPNLATITLLEDPQVGVAKTRTAVSLPVGTRGRNPKTGAEAEFEYRTIRQAIYSTGWDGDVVITASAGGEKKVHTR